MIRFCCAGGEQLPPRGCNTHMIQHAAGQPQRSKGVTRTRFNIHNNNHHHHHNHLGSELQKTGGCPSRRVASSGSPCFLVVLPASFFFTAMATFHCGDCEMDRAADLKYIVIFKDERTMGAGGRKRRSEAHSEGDRIRCYPCHKTLGRIYAVVRHEVFQQDFTSIKGDARVQLIRDGHDTFGDELAETIIGTIEQS